MIYGFVIYTPIQQCLILSIYFECRMLGDGFPQISPHIQVMSNVSHPAIQENTFYYTGRAMQQWIPGSSHLINVVKMIE